MSSKHCMQSGFHHATQQSLSVRSTGGARRQVTRMMPIGVPRVPYRTPRENVWQWVDIWNCLVRAIWTRRSGLNHTLFIPNNSTGSASSFSASPSMRSWATSW